MAEMSPVETLRAAAERLRERAKDTTPGPWQVANDTYVVRGLEVTGRGSYTCIQSVAEISDDRCDWDRDEAVETNPEDDAAWIALVHPGVAEPLADWLDGVADDHRAVESIDVEREECVISTVSPDFKRRTSARHILPALAVARVLLGVPDGR